MLKWIAFELTSGKSLKGVFRTEWTETLIAMFPLFGIISIFTNPHDAPDSKKIFPKYQWPLQRKAK